MGNTALDTLPPSIYYELQERAIVHGQMLYWNIFLQVVYSPNVLNALIYNMKGITLS